MKNPFLVLSLICSLPSIGEKPLRYKLWRKTHGLARGMKATFLCKTACPLLGICID